MYRLSYIFIILAVFVSGCSLNHEIQVSPTLSQIHIAEPSRKIHKKVGYYISQKDRASVTEMPAAVGETISYKPYKESEVAFNTVLTKVFDRVYSIKSMDDEDYIKSKNISYIFIPKIVTRSQSDNILSWVPTQFTFKLICKAVNPEGKVIWKDESKAIGTNDAFSGNDFSLAARRASGKAFVSIMKKITNSKEF